MNPVDYNLQREMGKIESELLKEILRLDTEERAALMTLLQGMWEPDIDRMINSTIVDYWLGQTRSLVKIWNSESEAERKRQDEMIYRDNLPDEERVMYLVSQLTESLQLYAPKFIREVLESIKACESGPAKWVKSHDSKTYLLGKVSQVFEGCDRTLRKEVIERYLSDIMPGIEEEWQAEENEQAAIDEFIFLVNPLSAEEIRSLTVRIQKELLAV